MTIYCSNKLKDFIGLANVTPPKTDTASPYGDWNGHLFFINRQKYLICVNNKTNYAVVIESIKKNDFKDIETLFFNRLTQQLTWDGIIVQNETLILLQKLLPLTLSQTNNDRRTIGTMNDFIKSYQACSAAGMDNLAEINHLLNDSLTNAGSKTPTRTFKRPIAEMKNLIKDLELK